MPATGRHLWRALDMFLPAYIGGQRAITWEPGGDALVTVRLLLGAFLVSALDLHFAQL